jgi:RNA polymerase sigma-70 factor (ECF subfamily)
MLRLRRLKRGMAEDCVADGEDAAEQVLDAERFERVRRAVEGLAMRYREPVVLRYLEELDTDEISLVLGISRNALQVRLSRARKLLKGHLAGVIDENEL